MENQEIKQYLINFVEKTLNQCRAFIKVYGEDFVRQRLDKNLDKVYTGLVSSTSGGGYDINDLSIKIYSYNKGNSPLMVQDIKDNSELQQTLLHESVHAIFRRTKEECETYGIKSGTGIAEKYNNGFELGRGLNEGLTEWICEKAGYANRAYVSELSIIKMLELAVGEEIVMKLANGNIRESASKLLGMSQEECVQLLAEVDAVYMQELKIYSLNHMKKELSKVQNLALTQEDESKFEERMGKDYGKYLELMKKMRSLIGEENKQNDVNSQLKYIDEQIKEETVFLDRAIAHVEDDIFKRYFKEEIEAAENSESISSETMQRLDKLYDSISGGRTLDSGYSFMLLIKFRDEIYDKLFEKHLNTIREQEIANEGKNHGIKNNVSWVKKVKQFFKKTFFMESQTRYLPASTTDVELKNTSSEDKNEFSQKLSRMVEIDVKYTDKNTRSVKVAQRDDFSIN